MATYNFNYLYIGRLAEADLYEGDFDNEGNSQFLNIFDSTQIAIAPVTVVDDDDLGDLSDDETGTTDTISYNFTGPAGAVSYSGQVDSTFVLYGTVTYAGGGTVSDNFTVIQTQNGDTFVLDSNNVLDNAAIEEIRFEFVVADNTSGHIIAPDEGLSNSTVVCLLQGTRVETAAGTRAVETLVPGDLIETMDQGAQPLRWVGNQIKLVPEQNTAIQIEKGALGAGCPARTLCVSPNHRLMVGNAVSLRMFNRAEVLVAAKALLPAPGVSQVVSVRPMVYWHLAFDRHALISAEGAWAESLHLGSVARRSMSPSALGAVLAAVPNHAADGLARFCPTPRQQRRFVERSLRNGHAFAKPARVPIPA